jgi:uncharacterized protein (DUF433 family)
MTAINRRQRITNIDTIDLRRMVGPDVHRPGAARARLLAEQIPVWAIVGYINALANTTNLADISYEVISRVAADYDVQPEAVEAALLYYQDHRGAIDALLEANAAALA